MFKIDEDFIPLTVKTDLDTPPMSPLTFTPLKVEENEEEGEEGEENHIYKYVNQSQSPPGHSPFLKVINRRKDILFGGCMDRATNEAILKARGRQQKSEKPGYFLLFSTFIRFFEKLVESK